jgi:hypothetical protein
MVGLVPLMMGMGGSTVLGNVEAPFFILMLPGAFMFGVDTFTTMLGVQVPNWIIATVVTLLIVKFFVVGAGSAMTRIGSKETVSLRVHGILITAVLSLAFAVSYVPTFAGMSPGAVYGTTDPGIVLAILVCLLTTPIVFGLPHLSTWSYLDEHKNKPGRIFDPRKVLTGAPEGGLPYILALLATVFLVCGGVWSYNGGDITEGVVVYMLWLVGAWTFFWSMGWLVSSFSTSGIGTARKSHLAFTIIVTLLPWPVLSIIAALLGLRPEDVFRIYPVAALGYSTEPMTVGFMALEFWLAAVVLTYWAERRRHSIVSSMKRAIHERKAA